MTTQPQDPTPEEPTTPTASPDSQDQATPPAPPAQEQEVATVRRPGWKLPPRPESNPDAETAATSDASGDSAEPSDELLDEPSTKTGSSRGSSRGIAKRKQQLRDGLKEGVLGATTGMHQLLARDVFDEHVDLYIADEEDAEDIAKPAASMLSRRIDMSAFTPDVADGIELGIAVAGYLRKQLGRWLLARQMRKEAEAIAQPEPDQAEPVR